MSEEKQESFRSRLLAEIVEQFLKDEYGSSGAEDNQGLTGKKAEDCAC